MKKREVVIVIVIVFCTMLVALLHVATGIRQRAFETEWSVPSAVPVAVVPPTPQRVADGESASTSEQEPSSDPESANPDLPESDQNDTSEETSSQTAHLVRLPGREEILRKNHQYGGFDRAFMKTYIGGLKMVESTIWLANPDFAEKFAGEIGSESLRYGDLETARDYLREAAQHKQNGFWRNVSMARLAWLEEDPRVVERLLEESCADDDWFALRNATELTEVTGSEQLRDYYAARLLSLPIEEGDRHQEGLRESDIQRFGRYVPEMAEQATSGG